MSESRRKLSSKLKGTVASIQETLKNLTRSQTDVRSPQNIDGPEYGFDIQEEKNEAQPTIIVEESKQEEKMEAKLEEEAVSGVKLEKKKPKISTSDSEESLNESDEWFYIRKAEIEPPEIKANPSSVHPVKNVINWWKTTIIEDAPAVFIGQNFIGDKLPQPYAAGLAVMSITFNAKVGHALKNVLTLTPSELLESLRQSSSHNHAGISVAKKTGGTVIQLGLLFGGGCLLKLWLNSHPQSVAAIFLQDHDLLGDYFLGTMGYGISSFVGIVSKQYNPKTISTESTESDLTVLQYLGQHTVEGFKAIMLTELIRTGLKSYGLLTYTNNPYFPLAVTAVDVGLGMVEQILKPDPIKSLVPKSDAVMNGYQEITTKLYEDGQARTEEEGLGNNIAGTHEPSCAEQTKAVTKNLVQGVASIGLTVLMMFLLDVFRVVRDPENYTNERSLETRLGEYAALLTMFMVMQGILKNTSKAIGAVSQGQGASGFFKAYLGRMPSCGQQKEESRSVRRPDGP